MGTRRILIIEDDKVSRLALAELLREEGFVVDALPNRGEGIAAAQANFPDVAILDHHLPDATGADIAAELRRWDPRCRVIMVSGSAQLQRDESGELRFENCEAAALEAGAIAYMTKPIDFDRLLATLHGLVGVPSVVAD